MVTATKKPQSLFKIYNLVDGDYGEPRVKNQYIKSSKSAEEIAKQYGKKIGEKPGSGFFDVEKVTKNEFNKGRSMNNIGRKYPNADYEAPFGRQGNKEWKQWSKAYDKISKKYDGKIRAERQVKAVNKITTVAKKINPVKEVNTIKSKAIKAIKTGVKVGGVVGLIGSLFAVTKMGDSTLKKK